MDDQQKYTCTRCKSTFPRTTDHTELIRRDFIQVPQPAQIERLCWDCFEVYVEEFLGEEFEERVSVSDADQVA